MKILMNKKQWYSLLIFFICNVLIGQQPTPVRVFPVQSKTMTNVRKVTGSIRASLRSEIAALESGRIDKILVREGQQVHQGEVIARLDSRRILQEIAVSKAQEEESKADYQRLEDELDIHTEEYNSLLAAEESFNGSISGQELRNARLKIAVTKGTIHTLKKRIATLEAQQQSLQISLQDMTLKASFTGVVVKKHGAKGSWVTSGNPVVTLLDTQHMEAWLDIPETIPARFIVKESIQITANCTLLSVKNLRIIPQIETRSRNYIVIAEVEGKHLLDGMSLTATIPNGVLQEHTLIPYDAILQNSAGYFVFKAQPVPKGMIAFPVPIKLLFRKEAFAAVQSQMLHQGDSVIIEGNERLFPMTPITLIDSGQKQ